MTLPDLTHFHTRFTLNMFVHLEQTSGLILNSFEDIEQAAIRHLRTRCSVYTAGPLFLSADGGRRVVKQQKPGIRGDDSNDEDSRCLEWLDSRDPDSVVYMSFGTLSTFSSASQMRELALGVESSGVPFLWVIRADSISGSLSELLPDGFLERVRDRGFFTPWAPQMEVLAHRSVGAFLSHCGWNSILENLALRGLPVLCWPDKAEQGVNARFLIDSLRLGRGFEKRPDAENDAIIGRDEVCRVLVDVMRGDAGIALRNRGLELKRLAESVVRPGGSTFRSLESLVDSMRNLATTAPPVATTAEP
jgi:hypothetical protein